MSKKIPTLGCCGLDCGLCPRYYTEGSSKCPGCSGDGFELKHPSCSFITCCFKKKNLEACGQCDEFQCSKFDRETGETDSFVTHRRVIPNLNFIREYGLDIFIGRQNKRIAILQKMLKNYNDGNCKSLYCLAATLLSQESLDEALLEVGRIVESRCAGKEDIKKQADIMKDVLYESAEKESVELKLRHI